MAPDQPEERDTATPIAEEGAPVGAHGEEAAAAAGGVDERYLRLAADFENFKKRKAQELSEKARYASEDAAKALLPVLDNLQRAVHHAEEGGSPEVFAGLELVVREFEAALVRLGVTPIDAVGQPFDPAVHEAVAAEDSDEVGVDTVIDELQRGYRLHDRVIRPAVVRIAHPRSAAQVQ